MSASYRRNVACFSYYSGSEANPGRRSLRGARSCASSGPRRPDHASCTPAAPPPRPCACRPRPTQVWPSARERSPIPKGGHFAAMDQPEALAREIVEFLRPWAPMGIQPKRTAPSASYGYSSPRFECSLPRWHNHPAAQKPAKLAHESASRRLRFVSLVFDDSSRSLRPAGRDPEPPVILSGSTP